MPTLNDYGYNYDTTHTINSDENIFIYLDEFSSDLTVPFPEFKDRPQIDFDAEATLFMDITDFRRTFKMRLPGPNNNSKLFGIDNNGVNLVNKTQDDYYNINPSQANVMDYTDWSGNLYPNHNGKNGMYTSQDRLNGEDPQLLNSKNINYKVCHDYLRYMSHSLGVGNQSQIFANRNDIVVDILAKGQAQANNIYYEFSKDPYVNTDQNKTRTISGHDIVLKILDQIERLNHKRLETQDPTQPVVKDKLVNTDNWQALPIIPGDVICFTFTFKDLSGVPVPPSSSITDTYTTTIPQRKYLIKLCISDDGDASKYNLETLVVDFDTDQLHNDSTPDDDEETMFTLMQNNTATNIFNNGSTFYPNIDTVSKLLAMFRNKPYIVWSNLSNNPYDNTDIE